MKCACRLGQLNFQFKPHNRFGSGSSEANISDSDSSHRADHWSRLWEIIFNCTVEYTGTYLTRNRVSIATVVSHAI